jgi:tetratricopeptide (TPR) repeat protein
MPRLFRSLFYAALSLGVLCLPPCVSGAQAAAKAAQSMAQEAEIQAQEAERLMQVQQQRAALYKQAADFAEQGKLAETQDALARLVSLLEKTLDSLTFEMHKIFIMQDMLLDARNSLAMACTKRGQHRKALEIHRRNLPDAERILGKEHRNTLATRDNIAQEHYFLGEYDKAIAIKTRVLEAFERTVGKDHPTTLSSRHNLAMVYLRINDYPAAKKLNEQTLEARERTLGEEHQQTLNTRENLALVYAYLGDYRTSLELLARTLASRERTQGKEDESTLTTLSNLGSIYSFLGDSATAREFHARALSGKERLWGADHPSTRTERSLVALRDTALGNHNEAIAALKLVADGAERDLGKEHPTTLLYYGYLAGAHAAAGDPGKGAALLGPILAAKERALGRDDLGAISSRAALADMHLAAGDAGKAKGLQREALAWALTGLGGGHPETGRTVAISSAAYAALGQPEAAIFYGKLAVLEARGGRTKLAGIQRDLQQTFLASVETRYHTLIGMLLAAGRNEEAQAVLCLLKEDELDDAVRGRLQDTGTPTDIMAGRETELHKEYIRRGAALSALGKEQRSLDGKKKGDVLTKAESAQLAETEKKLESARAAFHAFLDAVEQELAGSGEESRKAAAKLQNLAALQNILRAGGAGSALVHALCGEEAVYLFLTTPDGLTAKTLPAGRERLKNDVEA